MFNSNVIFCGKEFKTPIITASGTYGNGREYGERADLSVLGGITTKAITLEPREGNKAPRIVETPAGMLNSIGLQNDGVNAFIRNWKDLRSVGTNVVANICGSTVDEYAEVVNRILDYCDVKFFEINVSCPNVKGEGMAFGQDPKMVETVVKAVRAVAGDSKIVVKLTPNVTDIAEIARAAEYAGADAISLINTLLGMRIDPVTGEFALANKTGGLSGLAIFPVAVRCVYQVAQAVNIPIIGMGGVSSGRDVAEMMRAGATLVAIGTANFTDVDNNRAQKIVEEFADFCRSIGVSKAADLIGAVHERS